MRDKMNNFFLEHTKLPKQYVWFIVIISALPSILSFIGFDFSSHFDPYNNFYDVIDSSYHEKRGAFTHAILETSSIIISLLTYFLVFTSYTVKKDLIYPVLGMVLLCTGFMDGFHTLIASRLIDVVADNKDIIPFTWALSRTFTSAISLIGICIVLLRKKNNVQHGHIFIFLISFFFLLIGYLSILFCTKSITLPKTLFTENLITRPWDIYPLCLYLLCIFGFYKYNKQNPSPFTHALLLSMVPNIFTQFHMAFGSSVLYDSHFNIAHGLKIISYGVPFSGLVWGHITIFKEKEYATKEMLELQQALDETALISETDPMGSITSVNDKFCEISKYERKDLLGRNHNILRTTEHDNKFFKEFWNTIQSGNIWSGEIKNIAKDGTYYWVYSTIYPRRNPQGKISKYVSIRYDITARKLKENEDKVNNEILLYKEKLLKITNSISLDMKNCKNMHEFYELFLQSLVQNMNWDIGHLYFYDHKTKLLNPSKIWSSSLMDLFSSFIKITNQTSFMSGEGLPGRVFESKVSSWIENVDLDNNYPRNKMTKSLGVKSALGIPVWDVITKEVILVIEVYSIEKKKSNTGFLKALEEIVVLFSRLRNKFVYDLELEAEKIKAIEYAKVKSDFLANMSHEIRTPMNGVIGMISLLDETTLDESQRDMLETIKSCSDGLLTILNDVLDFSKMESGQFNLELIDFSVRNLAEDLVFLSSYQAKDKGISISVDVSNELPGILHGDITRIRQVLLNLITNAVKFTEIGSVKILFVGKSISENELLLTVTVEDTGIGISDDEKKNLFSAFTQADSSTTRKYGGTGLGLSISSKLVELMNGSIKVESAIGEGSCFTCTLPIGIGSLKSNSNTAELKSKDLPKQKILVVEDNLINQKIVTLMIKKVGYDCDIAENGAIALEMLESSKDDQYTIIFMDMQMPVMDGVEATKKIVLKYGESRPAIIAMTANAFKEDKETCLNAGMSEFMTKPLKIEKLRDFFNKYS
jgi:PAS domain S-box-containing protein